MDPVAHPTVLLAPATARYDAFLGGLEQMVNVDCGSWNVAGVNAVADLCAARMVDIGMAVERLAPPTGSGQAAVGDLLMGRLAGAVPPERGGRRLLLLGHMDTVFDDGEAAERPFRTEGGRGYGPGVTDDKAGILAGLAALDVLVCDLGFDRFAEIVFVCSPDEEIGSPSSRPVLHTLARDADIALCLECARANGDLVSSRKGVVDLVVDIRGRAAHAGIEPERGINAAREAAAKTLALSALNDRWPGVTVNVGVIRAGSRPNIVCPRARLEVDLRGTTRAAFAEALAAVEEITATATVPGATAVLRRLAEHEPWERDAATAELVETARSVGARLGIDIRDAATGGAGDANTVAAVGVATLDGLGPVGGDDHAPTEWLALESIAPRVALLAGVVARVGSGGPAGVRARSG